MDRQPVLCITGNRQTGKTERLLRHAAEKWVYIVVPTPERARWLAQKARTMALDIPFPICYEEVRRGGFGVGVRWVAFDDVDELLSLLVGGVPVTAITVLTEEETQ